MKSGPKRAASGCSAFAVAALVICAIQSVALMMLLLRTGPSPPPTGTPSTGAALHASSIDVVAREEVAGRAHEAGAAAKSNMKDALSQARELFGGVRGNVGAAQPRRSPAAARDASIAERRDAAIAPAVKEQVEKSASIVEPRASDAKVAAQSPCPSAAPRAAGEATRPQPAAHPAHDAGMQVVYVPDPRCASWEAHLPSAANAKPYVPRTGTHSRATAHIAAWRRAGSARMPDAGFDWHDIVPRLDASQHTHSHTLAHEELIAAEMEVISQLQGFAQARGARPQAITAAGGAVDDVVPDITPWLREGGDAGPLRKMDMCQHVRSKCLIHATVRECVLDELCGWCAHRSMCVERTVRYLPERDTGKLVPSCEDDLLVLLSSIEPPHVDGAAPVAYLLNEEGGLEASPIRGADAIRGTCHIYVSRSQHFNIAIGGNAKMAYHFFTENAPDIFRSFAHTKVLDTLAAHVYIHPSSEREFVDMLHAFTDSCWRYIIDIAAMDARICYAATPVEIKGDPQIGRWNAVSRQAAGRVSAVDAQLEDELTAIARGMRVGLAPMARIVREQALTLVTDAGNTLSTDDITRQITSEGGAGFSSFIVQALGLQDAFPSKPLVTLISRRNKRLILNEFELVQRIIKLGAEVVVVSLETMPLYEQVRLFSQTTVLVGIHGSGLINSIFMRPGTSLVQLMPFNVKSGAAFFQGPAQQRGVHYFEWANTDRSRTVFHWHFLGTDYAEHRESIVREGSDCCGQATYFSFWINQDTWVDEREFEDVMRRALEASAQATQPQTAR